jgi:hypothetical protein
MPSHVHRKTDRGPNGLGRAIKPSDDKDKSQKNLNKLKLSSSEDDAVPFNELTLDDFGGRSDAPGG